MSDSNPDDVVSYPPPPLVTSIMVNSRCTLNWLEHESRLLVLEFRFLKCSIIEFPKLVFSRTADIEQHLLRIQP